MAFIMLNPSTADAVNDDPTIRRCIRFARDTGYGSLVVGNLFAWRATTPGDLLKVAAPIGPDNDFLLSEIIVRAPLVVCAWGVRGTLLDRDKSVLGMIGSFGKIPHCLGQTRTGQPVHPLYIPADRRPTPMANDALHARL